MGDTTIKIGETIDYKPGPLNIKKYGLKSNPDLYNKVSEIVSSVNNSFEYDFERAKYIFFINNLKYRLASKKTEKIFRFDIEKIGKKLFESTEDILKKEYGADLAKIVMGEKEKVEKWKREAPYISTGRETRKGICSDAGLMILNELRNLEEKENFTTLSPEFKRKTYYGLMIEHDVSLLVENKTGEWLLINSKSPYLKFDVFPEEYIYDIFIGNNDLIFGHEIINGN